MSKLSTTAIIVLAIGLAMAIVGAVMQGINYTGDFNGQPLASVLREIGYIAAALSGIVLVASGVASAVRHGQVNAK